MIRINLLPSKKKKAFALPPTFIYGIAAMVVVIVAVIAGFDSNFEDDNEANPLVTSWAAVPVIGKPTDG